MLDRLFQKSNNSSYAKIIFSILSIAYLRTFLENFSNPDQSGYFYSSHYLFLHYPIYFVSLFLSFSLLVYFFTKQPILDIFNFNCKAFLFILLPPILDLLTTNGKGAHIAYITTEPHNFITVFIKLINPLGYKGVTFGVHIAAYLILGFLAIYIYNYTRSIFKSTLFIASGYCILFLYAISPSILALPSFLSSPSNSAQAAYILTLQDSWLKIMLSTGSNMPSFLSYYDTYLQDTIWMTPLTQLLFLLTVMQLIAVFFINRFSYLKSLRLDLRLERILTWIAIGCSGMFLNFRLFGSIHLFNFVNLITLCVYWLLIILNIWIAAIINDIEDVEIDKISNPDRPLASGRISKQQLQAFQIVLIVLIIFGLLTLSHVVVFLLLLAQGTYYLYSAQPLRLKSNFIFSSLLTGIAALMIFMSGFFLVSPDQKIKAFPVLALLAVPLGFGLVFNLKDLKDYDGDKSNNIKTLPVFMGLKRAKLFLAILCSLVFILAPLLLDLFRLLPLSLATSIFMTYLLTKKTYSDKHVFFLLFIYLTATMIFIG